MQQTVNAAVFPELYGFSELAVGNINLAVSLRYPVHIPCSQLAESRGSSCGMPCWWPSK